MVFFKQFDLGTCLKALSPQHFIVVYFAFMWYLTTVKKYQYIKGTLQRIGSASAVFPLRQFLLNVYRGSSRVTSTYCINVLFSVLRKDFDWGQCCSCFKLGINFFSLKEFRKTTVLLQSIVWVKMDFKSSCNKKVAINIFTAPQKK